MSIFRNVMMGKAKESLEYDVVFFASDSFYKTSTYIDNATGNILPYGGWTSLIFNVPAKTKLFIKEMPRYSYISDENGKLNLIDDSYYYSELPYVVKISMGNPLITEYSTALFAYNKGDGKLNYRDYSDGEIVLEPDFFKEKYTDSYYGADLSLKNYGDLNAIRFVFDENKALFAGESYSGSICNNRISYFETSPFIMVGNDFRITTRSFEKKHIKHLRI